MKISKILLGAAMFIAAPVVKGGCQMMAQNAPQEPIVVDTPFVHDPVMAYENGKYYLYCTGHGITQMTSTDRKHWTIVPQGVLKNSPDFDKMCTYKITYPNFQAFSKNNLCKWVTQRLFFVSLHHVCT